MEYLNVHGTQDGGVLVVDIVLWRSFCVFGLF